MTTLRTQQQEEWARKGRHMTEYALLERGTLHFWQEGRGFVDFTEEVQRVRDTTNRSHGTNGQWFPLSHRTTARKLLELVSLNYDDNVLQALADAYSDLRHLARELGIKFEDLEKRGTETYIADLEEQSQGGTY